MAAVQCFHRYQETQPTAGSQLTSSPGHPRNGATAKSYCAWQMLSPRGEPQSFQPTPEQRAAQDLNYRKWQLIQSEGVAVVLEPSFRDAGIIYVAAATVPSPSDVPFEKRANAWDLSRPVITPQVDVAAEQYNRVVRLVARGIPVQLEVNIAARFHDDDSMSYNVIAEIRGADLKDEVVMVGGASTLGTRGQELPTTRQGLPTALEEANRVPVPDLQSPQLPD